MEDTRFASLPSVSATMLTDKGIYSASLNHQPSDADDISSVSSHSTVRKNSSVDSSDPAVKKVVYNLYRGLLGTYNEKANGMISSLPAERVREDQGITRQVESMMRQSAEITGALGCRQRPCEEPRPAMAQSTGSLNAGGSFPPPPPPMPTNGAIPSIRLQAESGPLNSNGSKGGKHIPGGGAPFSYIPPAAIQNAMMTKDKKPFTYTPGGIDLSEIRSPRIQRRISKNAADEGVVTTPAAAPRADASGVPIPPPLPPQALAAMQPQLAVPVFPSKLPPPPSPPAPAMAALTLHNAPPPPPPPPVLKSTAFMEAEEKPVPPPMVNPQSRSAGNVTTNGEASRYAAPTYHHQPRNLSPLPDSSPLSFSPRNSPAESPLPESQPQQQNRAFVDRRNVQVGSIYIPPVTSSVPAPSTSPSTFTPQLSKSPMPWMNSQNRAQNQSPPLFVQEVPRATDDSRSGQTGNVRVIPLHIEGRDPAPAAPTQNTLSRQQSANTRIIPIQIEGGYQPATQPQQYQQPPQPQHQQQYQPQYQQQQYQQPPQYQQQQYQYQQQQPQYQQQMQQPQYQQQPPWRTNVSANQITPMVENLPISGSVNDRQQERNQPIQSRSFRILQMLTDTQPDDQDSSDSGRQSQNSVRSGPPPVGERRLQLTQDDRELMDMFRAQVSEDSSLHQEPDPRYRGSHIPSRAFRILQNFTDTSDSASTGQQQPQMARQQSVNRYGQQPAGNVTGNGRGYVPASEQNAPEPRKYMGGSIPSRSFRMLQQMTAAEDESIDQSHVAEISDEGYETQNSNGESLQSLTFSPFPPNTSLSSPSNQPANPKDSKDNFGSVLNELKNFKFKSSADIREVSANSRGPDSRTGNTMLVQDDASNLVTPTIRVEDYEENEGPVKPAEVPAVANPANLQTNPIDSEADSSESSEVHLEGRNHCRLFRLLSTDSQESTEATQPSVETGANTCESSFIQELDSNLPRAVPGAYVRLRSRRPRSHIPSRFFRFLQQEFDSSTSDDISSPISLEQNFFSQISSATGETLSSAASELEGYFGAN